jgi:hypothetical protein
MQTSPEPYSATQPEWNGPAAQPSCVLLDEEDGALHALASATRETAPNNSAHFGTMPRSPAVARGIDEEDFELVPDPFKIHEPFPDTTESAFGSHPRCVVSVTYRKTAPFHCDDRLQAICVRRFSRLDCPGSAEAMGLALVWTVLEPTISTHDSHVSHDPSRTYTAT